MKNWFLFICFFILEHSCFGQKKEVSLEVVKSSTETSEILIDKLNKAQDETEKEYILLRLAYGYYYKRFTTDPNLDSCYNFTSKAYQIAKVTHNEDVTDEALFMFCKIYEERKDTASSRALLLRALPWQRIRLLLVMSEFIVFRHGATTADLDKALPLISRALKISKDLHLDQYKYECQLLLGKYYFKIGDLEKGKNTILDIMKGCAQKGDIVRAAHYWSELGLYMPENDSTYRFKTYCHNMAYQLYLRAKKPEDAAYSLRDVSTLNLNHGNADTAERQMLQAISLMKKAHVKLTLATYLYLADIYIYKGDYPRALSAAINAMNTIQGLPPGLDNRKPVVSEYLGEIYRLMGDYQKSLPYYQIAFAFGEARKDYDMYYLCHVIIEEETKLGLAQKALKTLREFERRNPPAESIYKQLIAASYGNIYNAMKKYGVAEKYFLQMIELEDQIKKEKRIFNQNNIQGSEAYLIIGKFYIENRRFAKANSYLLKSLLFSIKPSAEFLRDIHYFLFKVDSAAGHLTSAIKHFELHKRINDSLFNATKSNQLEELQIQYEVNQKEQQITLLDSKNKVQETELQKANLQRNITAAGILMLIVVASVTLNGYKNKQRSNLKLRAQQSQINHQNELLQNLVVEKDWLLKEVHHRVKNNLQIVMSLLSTQSAYLENTAALDAITESRNRVQAISLIHQKLHITNNLANVDMQVYTTDLVGHLRDCLYLSGRNIKFELLIEPIQIDIAQAVPLGLIMNEAITNAVKYAFNESGGEIIVALERFGNKELFLTIKDNGRGLPSIFDIKQATSLGMEMMKALSKQLGGTFNISNTPGVVIIVKFPIPDKLEINITT